MAYSRMRSLCLRAAIGAALFAAIFSFVAVWHSLWDDGHQLVALVYGAQCAGGFWLWVRTSTEKDRLRP